MFLFCHLKLFVNRWRFELVAPPSGREDDCPVPRDHPHLQESHVRRLQDPLGSGQLSVVDFTTLNYFTSRLHLSRTYLFLCQTYNRIKDAHMGENNEKGE
jgi:hypothetical protein